MADRTIISNAFVLGAGLGTRLRPLTNHLPKPLVPFFQKPLIAHAFDHLIEAGVRSLIVNTHHLPGAYEKEFPIGVYRGVPITFRHEPVLLETGGGIKNIEDLLAPGSPLIVYNGDILSNLPLRHVVSAHFEREADVTLALRRDGGPLRVIVDEERNEVLGFGSRPLDNDSTMSPNRLFTGISIIGPALFDYLHAGRVESVIKAFERMISDGRRVLGVTVDAGHWFDLGSREALLAAHRQFIVDLATEGSAVQHDDHANPMAPRANMDERIHPTATIHPDGVIDEFTVMGPRSVVEAGAIVTGSILLAGAKVSANCRIRDCIISPGVVVSVDLTEQIA